MQPLELQTSILQRVLMAYGLQHAVVGEPQKGYRNTSYPVTLPDRQQENIIFYKSEPGILERIRRTNAVSDFAAAAGLPTRQSHGRIIRLASRGHEKFAARYSYLPGHTIPWEAYTKGHIKLLGLGLAKLHQALAHCPVQLPKVTDEYSNILSRMEGYFSNPDVQRALAKKLQLSVPTDIFKKYQRILATCAQLPGQQPLHMDFVRGNILFQPAQPDDQLSINGLSISGILDFEKTAHGHPLFDVARTLAFLLVDCKYKQPEKVHKYFLQSGYIKRGGQNLPRQTYPLLKELTNLFLLYDFYKFLRHNPYEYLHKNEHFIRTKHILLRHKLVE